MVRLVHSQTWENNTIGLMFQFNIKEIKVLHLYCLKTKSGNRKKEINLDIKELFKTK